MGCIRRCVVSLSRLPFCSDATVNYARLRIVYVMGGCASVTYPYYG